MAPSVPSRVATRDREITQPQARLIHERHASAAGLRWWSVHEALWTNVTLFDRVRPKLRVHTVHALSIEDADVVQAAAFLALPPGRTDSRRPG